MTLEQQGWTFIEAYLQYICTVSRSDVVYVEPHVVLLAFSLDRLAYLCIRELSLTRMRGNRAVALGLLGNDPISL